MLKKGFTLAEVLLTLTIIGVVAAMTIPNLIANTQKQEYVVALKKSYANANAVMKEYLADVGCIGDLVCAGLSPDGDYNTTRTAFHSDFDKRIQKFLNISKVCNPGEICDYPHNYLNQNSSNTPSTGPIKATYQASGALKFYLTDGSLVWFNFYPCYLETFSNKGNCGIFQVDINGPKLPNQMGRDIYGFRITRSGIIYPETLEDGFGYWKNPSNNTASYNCSTSEPSQGYGCISRIMEENWQMNY